MGSLSGAQGLIGLGIDRMLQAFMRSLPLRVDHGLTPFCIPPVFYCFDYFSLLASACLPMQMRKYLIFY